MENIKDCLYSLTYSHLKKMNCVIILSICCTTCINMLTTVYLQYVCFFCKLCPAVVIYTGLQVSSWSQVKLNTQLTRSIDQQGCEFCVNTHLEDYGFGWSSYKVQVQFFTFQVEEHWQSPVNYIYVLYRSVQLSIRCCMSALSG